MKVLLTLIIGFLLGFGTHWYLADRQSDATVAHAREAEGDEGIRDVSRVPKDSFDTEYIKEELSRTGKVIREKARQAGEAISDAADNAATTASIKAKLLKDSATSGLAIDVDTTDGVVTLSGKVASHEEIARAMGLAMETKGVRKVVSALQVEEPQSP